MLKDKTAFITGASKGIGKAIAKLYAKNGANIILNARNKEQTEKFAKELRGKYNVEVNLSIFDISNYIEVKLAFKDILKYTKKIDIVVNNAGILESSLIGMLTKDKIERIYATNVYSIYYILQYASRIMSRNNGGSIINMTSIIGTNGAEGQSAYAGSKAAVVGITKSLAKELASNNIRVNAIAPGFIDTDMTKNLDTNKYEERVSSIKMGKVGKPEDVANVALFLASDLSSYVTGQVIGVDGGMLI